MSENEERESQQVDKLTPNQHETAVALAAGALERHEEFGKLYPEGGSKFERATFVKKDRPDGSVEEESLEVASRNVGYLQVTHRQHWDDELLVPRYVDSYTMMADYGSSARGHMVISDGKVRSADYLDNDEPSNSVRGEPARGFEMASYVIGEVQNDLLASAKP